MKLVIYIVGAVLVALVLLVGIMALIGSRLPKNHVASRSIFLRKSPQDVYAVIRDFASMSKWRQSLQLRAP